MSFIHGLLGCNMDSYSSSQWRGEVESGLPGESKTQSRCVVFLHSVY